MRLGRALAPVLLAAAVAACTGSGAGATPTAAPASTVPSAAASMAPSAAPSASTSDGYSRSGGGASASAPPAAASGSIALAQTSLGSVLAGPSGLTLYMFTPDSSTSSACTGSCASTWPPLAGALPSLGTGLSASDFGTITRSDGTAQVTFHGHPLYYFSGDKAAGDTNGQGIGTKWYVLGADGNPIK